MSDPEIRLSDAGDANDLHRFGYVQSLRRTLGPYASFAIAFSMISISTAIFFLLPSLFGTSGALGVWLWIPCAAGVFLIVLVYAHLAARIPITGFAYQWNSRLINPHYGWFTGYTALLAFIAGTAATAVALATVFANDIWKSPTHGDIVLFAAVSVAVAVLINVISIRAVSAVNNIGVFFEIVGSVGAAALLFVGSIFFFHHRAGFHILVSTQRTSGGALWYGFVLAALLPLYCFIGWEGAADLAEETNDPRSVTPSAMIRANYVSVAASLFMIVGFLIAVPHGVNALLGQPKNALVYIFQSHFGAAAAAGLQVVVFAAIFSCVLANMVVATRLTFALSRDKMLPGSSVLGKVNDRTHTPIASILLVGAVPVAAFTVTKLRWLAENEPDLARRVTYVMLPHDYLTLRLGGVAVTDRGDASGTGYWSPATGQYRNDLVRRAFGRDVVLPRVASPHELVAATPSGVLLAPGTGDNMATALGLELTAGDVVISLGTSGTAFAISDTPTADASGAVAGFADATGKFLPLVCTLNAARVLAAVASLLGMGLDEIGRLALTSPPGAEGLVLLPYLDGERTPNLPDATGSLLGLTRTNLTAANIARASVEGMLCGLADAVDALRASGVVPKRLLLVGGAASNAAVQQIAATLFGIEVDVPTPAQYVARGAAWQAAWALADGVRPQWTLPVAQRFEPDLQPQVRENYAAARAQVYG